MREWPIEQQTHDSSLSRIFSRHKGGPMKKHRVLLILSVVFWMFAHADAQVAVKKSLTLELAKKIAVAAEAEARKK